MKITLDLSKLLEEGKLTLDEAERLKAMAACDTGSLAINILIGFGVVAVSAGAVALLPTPLTALVLGVVLFGVGVAFTFQRDERWGLLAQICLVVGALMFCGGVLALGDGALGAMLIVTAALAVAAIVARSSLLTAAAVLALGACLGAQAGYWHATYALAIYEPAVTIVLFSALALAIYFVSKRLPAEYERLALVAARTSVFMVNFGFWIGSLWGDNLRLIRSLLHNDPSILSVGRQRAGHRFALHVRSGLGDCADRGWRLGHARQPALGGERRGCVRGDPSVYAVVRQARARASGFHRRRSVDAGVCVRVVGS